MLLAVLAQACAADQSGHIWYSGGGASKETGAKTGHFRQRGSQCTGEFEKTDVFLSIKVCKPILIVT